MTETRTLRSVTFFCVVCGDPIDKPNRCRKTCSNECSQRRQKIWARERFLANRDEIRRSTTENKAKKLGVFVESIDRNDIFKRDSGLCGICGEPVNPDRWHMDHIIPYAAGGLHERVNVQVAHPKCNEQKNQFLDDVPLIHMIAYEFLPR